MYENIVVGAEDDMHASEVFEGFLVYCNIEETPNHRDWLWLMAGSIILQFFFFVYSCIIL